MLPPHQAQAQVAQTQAIQTQPTNNTQPAETLWTVVGQYSVGTVALLAILKAYADYQLKAAAEDRAFKNKESTQDLETKERIYGNVISQNEKLSISQGQLLNTFIAKTLNQAETNNEQTSSLILTISNLTEAIRFLTDTQQQQTTILCELKGFSESHTLELSVLHNLESKIMASLELNSSAVNQILAITEKLLLSGTITEITDSKLPVAKLDY